MKKSLILLFVCIIGFLNRSAAQAKTTKSAAPHQTTSRAQNKQKAGKTKTKPDTASFTSASSNAAYGNRLTIADPTINRLNQRAMGNNVPVSSSGIVGMPKGTYGFANGKIFLRTTTATSSGTNYGSGAVGTGTSIMGVGTGENTPGMNGKNPYAGVWFWGDNLSNTRPTQPSKNQ